MPTFGVGGEPVLEPWPDTMATDGGSFPRWIWRQPGAGTVRYRMIGNQNGDRGCTSGRVLLYCPDIGQRERSDGGHIDWRGDGIQPSLDTRRGADDVPKPQGEDDGTAGAGREPEGRIIVRFIVVLLIAAACFGQATQNVVQTGTVDARGASWLPPSSTFASPPATPAAGSVYIFTDASAVVTCSGGGSSLATCRWSGSAWAAVGGSGGGGGGSAPYLSSLIAGPDSTKTIAGATHGFATTALLGAAYDNASPRNALAIAWTVNASTYDVVITFGSPKSNYYVVINGGVGPAGPTGATGAVGSTGA